MFTLRDIVDIAIKIERNGAATYRGAARRSQNEHLASLLEWLADQEVEHAAWFEAVRDVLTGGLPEGPIAAMGRRMLDDVVGEKSLGLDEVDFDSLDSVADLLSTAIDLEGNTILFYEMLGGLLTDPKSCARLGIIVDEEREHAKLLLEFLETGTVTADLHAP
jgi:rubrerythrin